MKNILCARTWATPSIVAFLLVSGFGCPSRGAEFASHVFMVDTDVAAGFVDGIQRFDRAGTFETRFGIDTNATYTSVTTDGKDLFVANFRSNEIRKYGPNGSSLGAIAISAFGNPIGKIEIDAAGSIYATRGQTATVDAVRLNPDGSVSQTYSHPSLTHGNGIDADADGTTWVRQSNNTLYKFSANGVFLSSYNVFQTPGNGQDLAIDEVRQILYLGHGGPGSVSRYDISTGVPIFLGSFQTTIPSNHEIAGVFVEPQTGHVFAVDFGLPGDHAVGFEFAVDGTLLHTYSSNVTGWASDIVAVAVPEPSTVVLITFAAIAAVGFIRRRRAIM
jgi:hypothetical protein